MEFDDIQAIVEVINQAGFARAARRLGVAKSVITRRIARLEQDLGTRLVNRSTKGVTATEAGLEFKERAERILAELAEARDAVASKNGEIVGRLRISLPLSFGLRYIAPLLAEWSKANPRLEIDAAYSDAHVDLLAERCDAAIRIGLLRDSTMIARRINAIKLVVVAHPDYLNQWGTPKSPDDLVNHRCLVYSGGRERSLWNFHSGDDHFPVIPAGRFLADSGEALLQAAEAGLGIAILPMFLAHQSLNAKTLVAVLANFSLPEEAIYVLRPPSAYVSAKVRGLIDLLLSNFGNRTPWD